MKQQKMIVVAVTLILALCIAAVAWPWGNVGLNVSEPEAQLDVGGDVLVRSNLTAYGGIDLIATSGFRHIPAEGMYASFGYGYPSSSKRAYIRVVHPDGSGSFSVGTNYIVIGNDISSAPSVRITPILSPVTGVVFKVIGGSPPKSYIWTNVYSP